jgi:hypothetical protein
VKILYSNSRFCVVNDGCPGLKIYDVVLDRVDMSRFGAFYDNMGHPYPADGLAAAKAVADRAEAEDIEKSRKFREPARRILRSLWCGD